MAKFCSECGAELRDGAKFCLKCGKAVVQQVPQAPMCVYCGAQLKSTSRFCLKCGRPVASQASQPAASIAQPVQQVAQPIQQTAQNAAAQAAQPLQQTMGSLGSMANGIKAMPNAGEIALDIPSLSAVSSATSGGLPAFVVPLITGTALGGISIPLLYQLPSPWPAIVGALVAALIAAATLYIKKLKGGARS